MKWSSEFERFMFFSFLQQKMFIFILSRGRLWRSSNELTMASKGRKRDWSLHSIRACDFGAG